MKFQNIKRNELDYVLTDILPVELSELFTYKYFYEYLNGRNNEIKKAVNQVSSKKSNINTDCKLFDKSKKWITVPLKFSITKSNESTREISVIQPLASLQIYLFTSIFQKEILATLEKNSVFSIRYHRRNNDLYYKRKNKKITEYFSVESNEMKRSVLQQTGAYFNVGPFQSIVQFVNSEIWFEQNSKFKYFLKMDYKSCFDSIYTHSFKWIVGRDTNDTKSFENKNLYTTLDRVMQNINCSTSNGIVVGPEFSRMVAEILLQKIDSTVHNSLLDSGYIKSCNYEIYRYVDDIFIFADNENTIEKIKENYKIASLKYMMQTNDNKLFESKIPFVFVDWISQTNSFTNNASTIMFNNKDEQKNIVINSNNILVKQNDSRSNTLNEPNIIIPYMFKYRTFNFLKPTLMRQFNLLISTYEKNAGSIVSYFFGMVLNKFQEISSELTLFKLNANHNVVYSMLDFLFYVYSFYPDFRNSQRLLSIISYVNDEFQLTNNELIQKIINKYSYIFSKGNVHDYINIIIYISSIKIEIPFFHESNFINQIKFKDDPILWAALIQYSEYNNNFFKETQNELMKLIEEKMDSMIILENILSYKEFWWLIVFNKSKYISSNVQAKFDSIITNKIVDLHKKGNFDKAENIISKIFWEYLKNSSEQFYDWNVSKKNFLRKITYKTFERSIFKNYQMDHRYFGITSFD